MAHPSADFAATSDGRTSRQSDVALSKNHVTTPASDVAPRRNRNARVHNSTVPGESNVVPAPDHIVLA
jgi:hypothetical protein